MQNRAWAGFRHKQISPFNILPQVEPKKCQRHQEQTEGRYLTSCTRANSVHQSVAGFDSKTAAIFFSDLGRLSFERPDHNVGETKDAFAFVFALAVFTNDI